MHANGMNLMVDFVKEHDVAGKVVVDMGSYDVNGNYRSLFTGEYTGADITPGPNVDVLVDSPEWKELRNIDVVISGQTLEHVADIPKFINDIFSILAPGGLLCLIAPSAGPAHSFPIWVGHFSAERMTEIVEADGFEIIECKTTESFPFNDTRCIARKPILQAGPKQKKGKIIA